MDEKKPEDMGLGMDPTTLGEVGSPIEQPIEQPVVQPNEQPVEQPIEQPIVQPNEQPVEQPVVQPETLDVVPPTPTQETKEEVGKNPPPKKKEKKPMGKGIFILLIIALIAGVAYGLYVFLSHGNSVDNRVKLKEVVFTLGEELSTNLEDYAIFDESINPNNCVLDVKSVDTQKEGIYDYKIICGDKEYPGKLEIKDLQELSAELKEVYKVKGGELRAEEFFTSCNKEGCKYEFVNEAAVLALLEDLGGPHDVELKVTFGGKELLVTGKLTVIESEFLAYLECTSPSNKHEEYNAQKVVVDRFVIGAGNKFLNIATRNYLYVFADDAEYHTVKNDLAGKNEFDQIVGKITFDDAEKQVLVTVNLLKAALDEQFPPKFPEEYHPIKQLYEGEQVGYTCQAKDA